MAAYQAPPSLGFSGQEHWSGLPLPSPMHERKSESEVPQSCPTLCDPWTAAYQAPLSIGFSRREYWSGLPLPSPSESKSCSIMSNSLQPMDHIVHGILQARILEWVAFPFSWGSSQPRDQTHVSHIAGGFFASWATNWHLKPQFLVCAFRSSLGK